MPGIYHQGWFVWKRLKKNFQHKRFQNLNKNKNSSEISDKLGTKEETFIVFDTSPTASAELLFRIHWLKIVRAMNVFKKQLKTHHLKEKF